MTRLSDIKSPLKSYGNSMFPILLDGDTVYFRKTRPETVSVNDIVIVRKKDDIIIHRVVYKSADYIITKGDNNFASDGRIIPRQLIGKIYQVKRENRIIRPEDLYLIQSTLYFQEIQRIVREINLKKVTYTVLKGLPVHLFYEKKFPRRLYADCDFLFRKNDKKIIHQILISLGFQVKKVRRYRKFQKYMEKESKEIIYFKKIRSFAVSIEVHFEVTFLTHGVKLPFYPFQKNVDLITSEFLKESVDVKILHQNYRILKAEDFILYLLLHFFSHNFYSAYRLYFLSQLISALEKKKKIDWVGILSKAEKYGVVNFIIPGIYLLKKYYSVSGPYVLVEKGFPGNFRYSMSVYRLVCREENLFDAQASPLMERVQRALLIFLLLDSPVLSKFYYLLNPKIVIHGLYSGYLISENIIGNLIQSVKPDPDKPEFRENSTS